MGINAELVQIVADLRFRNTLRGDSVIEIGAQDVCVASSVVAKIFSESHINADPEKTTTAADLYKQLGFSDYVAIDASGDGAALIFDLNKDVLEHYHFAETFDLVTNLGTAEHCFNQYAVFKNLHDLCKTGGVMIHALTAQGNVNHGFYNYHPRFIAELAVANNYEIVDMSFTVDYKPTLIKYTKSEFQKWDSHDLLLYAVLRKGNDSTFNIPFDGMFASANQLTGYNDTDADPLVTEFSPYLKGGKWENTSGVTDDEISPVRGRLKAYFRHLLSSLF